MRVVLVRHERDSGRGIARSGQWKQPVFRQFVGSDSFDGNSCTLIIRDARRALKDGSAKQKNSVVGGCALRSEDGDLLSRIEWLVYRGDGIDAGK